MTRSLSQYAGECLDRLLLGPFGGNPACRFIPTAPGKAKGVSADAYAQANTTVVPEVDLYRDPGQTAK